MKKTIEKIVMAVSAVAALILSSGAYFKWIGW
jgi:hypothetical protein